MKKVICGIIILLSMQGVAQQKDYASDVASPDAIIAALYDVISGEAGTSRDWDRFRNLFHADAKLWPTRKSPEGHLTLQPLAPADYVTLFSTRVSTGFFERELHRKTEQYGTLVHAFSTYETKEKKEGPVTNRGINSIQIFSDGKRYFIVNVFWCAEGLGFPLPDYYVGKSK